ncbi:tetratricopeptide repeat protein [Maridesulfovibrio sp.]|uniref:tetratricopeptide repeat protein n=1 Tax=Maridesulfovibrio sp. TaxID=2795000 RepID=UPI002A189290|nr:tetratricopeptide repeat protein [Maridesulfovibrio sp.]
MCGFSKVWQLSREGMEACNRGDFFTAENNLRTAISLSGCKSKKIHKATMYNNLAVVYQMSGKFGEAIDAYSSAVNILNPDHKGQANLIKRIKGKMDGLKEKIAA